MIESLASRTRKDKDGVIRYKPVIWLVYWI